MNDYNHDFPDLEEQIYEPYLEEDLNQPYDKQDIITPKDTSTKGCGWLIFIFIISIIISIIISL
jgi:hypothetical protein